MHLNLLTEHKKIQSFWRQTQKANNQKAPSLSLYKTQSKNNQRRKLGFLQNMKNTSFSAFFSLFHRNKRLTDETDKNPWEKTHETMESGGKGTIFSTPTPFSISFASLSAVKTTEKTLKIPSSKSHPNAHLRVVLREIWWRKRGKGKGILRDGIFLVKNRERPHLFRRIRWYDALADYAGSYSLTLSHIHIYPSIHLYSKSLYPLKIVRSRPSKLWGPPILHP